MCSLALLDRFFSYNIKEKRSNVARLPYVRAFVDYNRPCMTIGVRE